jgi:hypothetical protein
MRTSKGDEIFKQPNKNTSTKFYSGEKKQSDAERNKDTKRESENRALSGRGRYHSVYQATEATFSLSSFCL